MTVKEAITWAHHQLRHSNPTTDLDVMILLAKSLNVSRSFLLAHPEKVLSRAQKDEFSALVQRRKRAEPVAYLLGYKDFFDIRLIVTTDTLIPRPETELLVELALASLTTDHEQHLLELGTGSGAIALALAHSQKHWHITATDNSAAALSVAQENARLLGLSNVIFYHGSWYDAVPRDKRYHAIISNPPYLAADDPYWQAGGLNFEPRQALLSDDHGLAAITHIVQDAKNYLIPSGMILLEHGFHQGAAVRRIFQQAGFNSIIIHQDIAGLDRVASARL